MTSHTDTVEDTTTAAKVRDFHHLLRSATGTGLPVRLPDGTDLGPSGAPFRIVLHDWWSLRQFLVPPFDLHAGEAYAEGAVDIEGDMEAAMSVAEALAPHLNGLGTRLRLGRALLALPAPPRSHHERRARLHGRRHSKDRDRAAIAFHYDLPDEFYRQFLDARQVYSCAYFGSPDMSLEEAQERKIDLICRKLRLRPGQRLLDIGCGWGSLLEWAAEHYGVTGVGVTLSRTQKEAADERLARAGLSDRVEVRLEDYRDLDDEFDAVCSVGMFEHVGPDHLGGYFAAAYRLTRPGGLFLNHGITNGDPRAEGGDAKTFVSTYVFPDGGLVPAWRAVREMELGGFEVVDVEQLRPHYTLTLRNWVSRLEANHDRAVALTSETDYRIWRTYMAGSAYSFDHGHIGLVQVLGSKGATLPLGRDWIASR
jgi:cyclopropane-fatty-acyl-phospholipid synthase